MAVGRGLNKTESESNPRRDAVNVLRSCATETADMILSVVYF